jgi:hypothetical protein
MIITMRFTCVYLPLTANVSMSVCVSEISKIKNLAVQRMIRNPTNTVMPTSKICRKRKNYVVMSIIVKDWINSEDIKMLRW